MKAFNYFIPSPLVVQSGWNLDTLIYLSLFTIFNPITVWILYFNEKVTGRYATAIVLFWICRYFNIRMRKSYAVPSPNKVVLISGGISGLGSELVKEWSVQKDIGKVIVVDVQKPEKETDYNLEKVQYIQYDLNDTSLKFLKGQNGKDDSADLVDLSKIDILVCNAGIRQLKTLQEIRTEDIEKISHVNWFSHMLLIKRYTEAIRTQVNGRRFHVVVVGSVLGFVGPKQLGVYAGTKNALMALMDSLREELPCNIVLSTVLPGQLDSSMFADVSVNQFLAPIIHTKKLARRIKTIVEEGLNGTFSYPAYGRLLPIYRVLPWWAQRFCRWFSGMDDV